MSNLLKSKQFSRFWSKVKYDKGCWVWAGTLRGGYGRFWLGPRQFSAHRVSYELANGHIPVRYDIDHLCRNSACVNPVHLEAVTRSENVIRGRNKEAQQTRGAKVTRCPKGHEYTDENTHRRPNGWRLCLTCARVWAGAVRARKK